MPLKGIYPLCLSGCSLVSPSAGSSSVKWARALIHTVWLHGMCVLYCVCGYIISHFRDFANLFLHLLLLLSWLCFSNLLFWTISLITGLWRRQQHAAGCPQTGQHVSCCDDRSQQIQVSLPETKQWHQRQSGGLLAESPHFSQLCSKLAQVRKRDVTFI